MLRVMIRFKKNVFIPIYSIQKEESFFMGIPPKDRIVVAEDSAPNRNILVHLLIRLGFEVNSFKDGQEAWDFMQSKDQKNLVAVISDIMMPRMDGLQLLKLVRSTEPFKKLPFLCISAVAEREYILEAKELNVTGYLLKPVTFDNVSNKLKEIFPRKLNNKILKN